VRESREVRTESREQVFVPRIEKETNTSRPAFPSKSEMEEAAPEEHRDKTKWLEISVFKVLTKKAARIPKVTPFAAQ
jgi:hypothetical protein